MSDGFKFEVGEILRLSEIALQDCILMEPRAREARFHVVAAVTPGISGKKPWCWVESLNDVARELMGVIQVAHQDAFERVDGLERAQLKISDKK